VVKRSRARLRFGYYRGYQQKCKRLHQLA
jgi:hypothetical protein